MRQPDQPVGHERARMAAFNVRKYLCNGSVLLRCSCRNDKSQQGSELQHVTKARCHILVKCPARLTDQFLAFEVIGRSLASCCCCCLLAAADLAPAWPPRVFVAEFLF
jgi:hypothetical protein